MTKILKAFWNNEDGLVTVEWVALASAMVIGAIAIGWLVMGEMKAPANTIGNKITTSQSNTL
jgi:Flp pilus assembly pilin Flp